MTVDNTKPHFESKYFDEIDNASQDDNYFIPVLKEVQLVLDVKSSRVLDVGCGTGVFLKYFIDEGCKECFGVDGPSEFTIRAINRGYKDVQHVADLSKSTLPFPDESFDLVVSKDVFEHLMDPIFLLSEIKRVLKKDSLFLMHVPNHFPLFGRIKFLFTNDIDTFTYFRNESRWAFPHIRFYEHRDSLNILSTHGFSLVKHLSYLFPVVPYLSRFKLFSPFIKYITKKYPNQFAGGFTYLLKKI